MKHTIKSRNESSSPANRHPFGKIAIVVLASACSQFSSLASEPAHAEVAQKACAELPTIQGDAVEQSKLPISTVSAPKSVCLDESLVRNHTLVAGNKHRAIGRREEPVTPLPIATRPVQTMPAKPPRRDQTLEAQVSVHAPSSSPKTVDSGVVPARMGSSAYVASEPMLHSAVVTRRSAASSAGALIKSELDPRATAEFDVIAEQMEQLEPGLVLRDEQGRIYAVRYEALNALLVDEFLKQYQAALENEAEVKDLEARYGRLEEELSQ